MDTRVLFLVFIRVARGAVSTCGSGVEIWCEASGGDAMPRFSRFGVVSALSI